MRAKFVTFGIYILLLAAAIIIETIPDFFNRRGGCALHEEETSSLSPVTYKSLVNPRAHNLHSQWVTVISLTASVEPQEILDNVCSQRWFLSRLISRLAKEKVRLIVLDKFFLDKSCNAGDEGTKRLVKEIQHSEIPVVVGLATQKLAASEPTTAAACLAILPSLNFGDKVQGGLTRLNSDTRKIPLEWPVFTNETDINRNSAVNYPTLSFIAAQHADKKLTQDYTLQYLLRRHTHPFTSFVSSDKLDMYSAMDVLCGDQANAADWKRCAPPNKQFDLAARIVVIGNRSDPRDVHNTVIGDDLPGVDLQANYIESLLTDRYFKPIPTYISVPLFFCWIGTLHLVFWKIESPERAGGVCLLIAASLWVISYIVVLSWSWFLTISIQGVSLLAIGVKWAEARGHESSKQRALLMGNSAPERRDTAMTGGPTK